MDKSENNKRVAKNTILLYIRMLISTLVSLFTARLTLQLLGVEDYGINNVVGGVVGFVGIVTGTMTSASQRFLAYYLGNNDIEQFQKAFSMLVNICAIFCCVVIIIMELIGPYMIHEFLVIPTNRVDAASWIYQFSIMSFCLTTMLIPFTSAIVSYEKMGIYAYFTIIDVAMKLLIVYMLYVTPIDKLVTLGALTVFSCMLVNVVNFVYCKVKLEGCSYKFYWNMSSFKQILSFAGWNLFGSTTSVLNYQGQAIMLNIFFGPVVNAAKAIADKINQIMYSFCQNFFMAMNPQIIKSYASGDIKYTQKLVFNSSKYSFYLFTLIALPIIFNMKGLLELWLGKTQVSDDMILFSQLILVLSFTNNLESPITQTVRATGNIKKYQFVIGVQTLCFLPITYLAFSLGAPAYTSMVILCLIYIVALFFRIYFLKDILKMRISEYAAFVVRPIVQVLACAVVILYIFHYSIDSEKLFWVIPITVVDVLIIGSVILLLGVSNFERSNIKRLIIKQIKKCYK